MLILGKLQDTRSLSNSIARATDFTKMTTFTSIRRRKSRFSLEVTYLIELEAVQQFIQLPVLPNLLQLNVMLLKTVERELGFIVNKDLKGLVEDYQLCVGNHRRSENIR